MATPAEPRGEKCFFVQTLGGEKLLNLLKSAGEIFREKEPRHNGYSGRVSFFGFLGFWGPFVGDTKTCKFPRGSGYPMGRGSVAKPCCGQALPFGSPARLLSQPGSYNKARTQRFHTSFSSPRVLFSASFWQLLGMYYIFSHVFLFSMFTCPSQGLWLRNSVTRPQTGGNSKPYVCCAGLNVLFRISQVKEWVGAQGGQRQALQHGLLMFCLGRDVLFRLRTQWGKICSLFLYS